MRPDEDCHASALRRDRGFRNSQGQQLPPRLIYFDCGYRSGSPNIGIPDQMHWLGARKELPYTGW